MKEKEIEKILKALANRRRVAIINLIKKRKSISVGDIAREIKLSLNAASKHLKVLSSVEILDKTQVGLTMLYRISEDMPKFAKHIISAI